MARKSTKVLRADVATLKAEGYKIGRMEDEVYGRDAHWYVNVSSQAERARVTARLEALGHVINHGYWPGGKVVDVCVTYFNGWHYDE